MNECRDCGLPVRFLLLGQQDDGSNRWSPPLNVESREITERKAKTSEPFAHQGYEQTERFVLHDCPERRAAKVRQDEAAVMRQVRARQTDEAWDEALKRDCPRCGAFPEHRCLNLTDVRLKRHPFQHTRHPHAERLPFGWAEERTA